MRHRNLICAIAALFISPAYAAEPDCNVFAHSTIDRIMVIFQDKTQNETQKRAALTTLFQEAVDTDWIGKFVLGKFWKSATGAEQQSYLKNYHAYLTHNYVSKFEDNDGFSVGGIQIKSITPAGEHQFEAKTLIQRKGEEDVSVDYLLDRSSAKCQVHDIKVEGVSLLTSQRSEFGALAGTSGVKGVIAALEKQIDNRE